MALDEDFQIREVNELLLIYQRAEREIQNLLLRTNVTDFQRVRANEIMRQVEATIGDLRTAQARWGDQRLPGAYRAGQQMTATENGTTLPTMSAVNRRVVAVLAASLVQPADDALQSVAPFVGNVFIRAAQQVVTWEQLAGQLGTGTVLGETVQQLTKRLVAAFRTGATEALADVVDPQLRADLEAVAAGQTIKIMGKDGVERTYNLSKYGETVARTTTRMAASEGVMQGQKDFGQDLVQVSVHANACPICIPYQGRIYSMSGNSPDFPPLEDDVPPYHPNCEHVLLPVVEDFLDARGIKDSLSDFSNGDDVVNDNAEYMDLIGGKQPANHALSATVGKAALRKYSPAEARDYHGRWTGGGSYEDAQGVRTYPDVRSFAGRSVTVRSMPKGTWEQTAPFGEKDFSALYDPKDGTLIIADSPMNHASMVHGVGLDAVTEDRLLHIESTSESVPAQWGGSGKGGSISLRGGRGENDVSTWGARLGRAVQAVQSHFGRVADMTVQMLTPDGALASKMPFRDLPGYAKAALAKYSPAEHTKTPSAKAAILANVEMIRRAGAPEVKHRKARHKQDDEPEK